MGKGRRGWLKDVPVLLGVAAPAGFLPVGCPNCHKGIEVGQEVLHLGYYRHRECVELLNQVVGKLPGGIRQHG